MTFEAWKAKVDKAIERKTGLSADDIEDYGYRDAFESGMTPAEAASEAIANSTGDEFGDFE